MTRAESSTRTCRKCKTEKGLSDFQLTSSARGVRKTICVDCQSEYKNSAEYSAKQREYSRKRYQDEGVRAVQRQSMIKYLGTINGRTNRMYISAKERARKRNLEFDLTHLYIEFVLRLGKCQKTGIPFSFDPPGKTRFNPFAPALDRKDPFGGYTQSNVQIVCNAYNLAKNQFTDEQLLEFCKKVVEYNDK